MYAAVAKPNFCQKCGGKFGGSVSEESLEEEEPSENSIPHLEGLDIDIEVNGPNTLKIDKLAGTRDSQNLGKVEISRPDGPLPSSKQSLEDFQKEASAIKKKS
ncbi:hypothetical protein CMI37_09705 [Candidatus Pacearchaeota archaeon]|nr:hypothetical protein [Candidatus Pacearchaeota archaeon]